MATEPRVRNEADLLFDRIANEIWILNSELTVAEQEVIATSAVAADIEGGLTIDLMDVKDRIKATGADGEVAIDATRRRIRDIGDLVDQLKLKLGMDWRKA